MSEKELLAANMSALVAFTDAFRGSLQLHGRQVGIDSGTPHRGTLSVYVNFINLPRGIGHAGGGAEAENNRAMFVVDFDHGDGKARVKQSRSFLPYKHPLKLRSKSGPAKKIGEYLASFIGELARIPPNFTHTK